MSTAGAYAIWVDDEIDVSTVSDTERAAKINWLVRTCGHPVFNHTADHTIDDAWAAFSSHYKAECIAVTIERKLP